MAGLGPGPGAAVPVWLTEDDLGCIICHGLLTCPATLPCGHSFCRGCLEGLWGARGAGRRWSCPTCRQGAAQQPRLQKNTLLQDLADKYSRAARELEADPGRAPSRVPDPGAGPALGSPSHPAQLPAAAQRSRTEVGLELAELAEQLGHIAKSLQSQRPLSEPGPESKPMTSNTFEGTMRDIPHALEEIQEKLRENVMWKEVLEEQTQELLEAPSSSPGPLPDQSHPATRTASQFAQWAINPTFDLGSLSCSLEVSDDGQTVTVSRFSQPYPWSRQRFANCQVLCSQALSSGKKYWEVDTQHCSHWAVGVASWEMSRDQLLGRTRDSWCVEWKGTGQLSAWHMEKETVLGTDRPGVVGIWLDLEVEKLAYYLVADQEKLLFECAVSTSCPLHPAFWLYGLHCGNSLTLKQVKA
ncbi:E3 ubiquitin-protein ligase RNF135 isoform X2 [Choloepus didactylus]|uniref:E3 ubiquitin-protein ligase RNF135 isoform X2 n=1 Tax=Choloepus didactylus TaxID=27675 RepID=UPI0018A10337|nr:E3 ubiquitin-protein ligase RNF135 isoform X2 [Choloepus didactylus]